jgi:hypothetical protein
MKIKKTVYSGRKAWELDNDAVVLTMTEGGGHIASLVLKEKPGLNPLWVPIWKSLELWNYKPAKHRAQYELKLLAAIRGHNLCLGWFGDASADEKKQGLETHGEAPVARWKQEGKRATKNSLSLTCSCLLPVSQMKFVRTLTTRKNSGVIDVREEIQSLSKRDLPFTICQHVTLGPPFLEKGVTLVDAPATKSHTFPGTFSPSQRLKSDKAFVWPKAPGSNGKTVDLRMIGKEYKATSDFATQFMDQKKDAAWFSAINPKQGLMVAYVWKPSDFPWLGIWEENFGRKQKPWAGKSLTRGMEFANTPFPVGLRKAVNMGRFHDHPTFGWLPAKGKVAFEYSIILAAVPTNTKGTKNIERNASGFAIDLIR